MCSFGSNTSNYKKGRRARVQRSNSDAFYFTLPRVKQWIQQLREGYMDGTYKRKNYQRFKETLRCNDVQLPVEFLALVEEMIHELPQERPIASQLLSRLESMSNAVHDRHPWKTYQWKRCEGRREASTPANYSMEAQLQHLDPAKPVGLMCTVVSTLEIHRIWVAPLAPRLWTWTRRTTWVQDNKAAVISQLCLRFVLKCKSFM